MESFVEKATPYNLTLGSNELLGKRVFSKSGIIMGVVRSIRLDKNNFDFEGFVVGNLLNTKTYICRTYVHSITTEAIFLNIDPASLLLGKAVVSSDGKKIGNVKETIRVKETNKIEYFVVKWGFFKTVAINFEDFSQIGDSLILKKDFDSFKNGAAK